MILFLRKLVLTCGVAIYGATTAVATDSAAPVELGRAENRAKTDEERLVDAIPQLGWSRKYLTTNVSLEPGHASESEISSFSSPGYRLLGVDGEIEFRFRNDDLIHLALNLPAPAAAGGAADFGAIYRALKEILTSPEKRDESGSVIEWTVRGKHCRYTIVLAQDRQLQKRSLAIRIDRAALRAGQSAD